MVIILADTEDHENFNQIGTFSFIQRPTKQEILYICLPVNVNMHYEFRGERGRPISCNFCCPKLSNGAYKMMAIEISTSPETVSNLWVHGMKS